MSYTEGNQFHGESGALNVFENTVEKLWHYSTR